MAPSREPAGTTPPSGASHSEARESARSAIPWRELGDADRRAASRVVGNATLYRQLPTRLIDCDEDLFAYLIDHPHLVVDCWNVMGVSQLNLTPDGPRRYRVADTGGATGVVRVIHRSGGHDGQPLLMVALADGDYRAPAVPHAIHGSSVLVLRAETVREANGRSYITARLDSFVRFERATTELVAKALKPLLMRTADHNFVETMRFVSLFSRTAETNPDGMARLATHLTRVDEPTRREFTRLCYATSDGYAERSAAYLAQRDRAATPRTMVR